MGSLFEKKGIPKTDIVKVLSKKLKELELTANFKDSRWKVLNENSLTTITDVIVEP